MLCILAAMQLWACCMQEACACMHFLLCACSFLVSSTSLCVQRFVFFFFLPWPNHHQGARSRSLARVNIIIHAFRLPFEGQRRKFQPLLRFVIHAYAHPPARPPAPARLGRHIPAARRHIPNARGDISPRVRRHIPRSTDVLVLTINQHKATYPQRKSPFRRHIPRENRVTVPKATVKTVSQSIRRL
jgi:hypothetical protein